MYSETNDGYWSGDFLNYLTTARIDALRKVFYGGKRSTDTSSSTILERSVIPQDSHSKEAKAYPVTDMTSGNIRRFRNPPTGLGISLQTQRSHPSQILRCCAY